VTTNILTDMLADGVDLDDEAAVHAWIDEYNALPERSSGRGSADRRPAGGSAVSSSFRRRRRGVSRDSSRPRESVGSGRLRVPEQG
jgi:hypothetical protein